MTNDTVTWLRGVADTLESADEWPHGPKADPQTHKVAGEACVALCGGDRNKAISLWKLITADLGYMPHSAAVTLIRASRTTNLVPDVTAPDPGGADA